MSMPSMKILPDQPSMILSKPNIIVLLPLPVRPTMPTFSPGRIVKFILLRTFYSYGLYLKL